MFFRNKLPSNLKPTEKSFKIVTHKYSVISYQVYQNIIRLITVISFLVIPLIGK